MTRPLVLFGAFDRHNVGDLLFPRICSALLPQRPHYFAGLAERDLRAHGGHRVESLRTLAARLPAEFDLLHVGGELLGCSAFEAAVMLLPDDQARAAMVAADACWRTLTPPASDDLLSYLADAALFAGARVSFNAIGGVDFERLDAAAQAEAERKLHQARWLGVRERTTQTALARRGLRAELLPDCVSMVAELFGEQIAHHARNGEPAAVRKAFPDGYIALQFSADFADEATLDTLARQLEQACARRLGVVLFRAGAAPWHDALEPCRQLAARLSVPRHVFESLHIFDICALIAGSRGYCGTSLHGRIVAMACALPRLNLGTDEDSGKQRAYAAAWDEDMPGVVKTDALAAALDAALSASPARLRQHARWLCARYREGFAMLAAALS